MFDTTLPPTAAPAADTQLSKNPALSRLAYYRREIAQLNNELRDKKLPLQQTDVVNNPVMLDLIACWPSDVGELRDAVEMASDWGPYELVEMIPAYYGDDGMRRILCRFVYHGDMSARSQFEHCMRATLKNITDWETAPQSPADTSAP